MYCLALHLNLSYKIRKICNVSLRAVDHNVSPRSHRPATLNITCNPLCHQFKDPHGGKTREKVAAIWRYRNNISDVRVFSGGFNSVTYIYMLSM